MQFKSYVLALILLALAPLPVLAGNLSDCSYNGTPLYGKVRVVEHFGDLKIREVQHFADLKVEIVSIGPNNCGQWEFVSMGEDFTVEFVTIGEDFTVEFVNMAPGIR